jgi:hypothetical protein
MIRSLDVAQDFEAAHVEEDELLYDYIRDIAEGCCDDMIAKANLIVEALDKSGTRWYA